MKLSLAKPRVSGVTMGEGSLNLIYPDRRPITGKFAILNDNGISGGYLEKTDGWSQNTLEIFQKLVESMETDALRHFFHEDEEAVKTDEEQENVKEPPQF